MTMEKKNLGLGNMNGMTDQDHRTCGSNDMNCGRRGEGADSERHERGEPGGRDELQSQRYELFEKKIKLLQLLLECDMM